jgi:hypothetical protein
MKPKKRRPKQRDKVKAVLKRLKAEIRQIDKLTEQYKKLRGEKA